MTRWRTMALGCCVVPAVLLAGCDTASNPPATAPVLHSPVSDARLLLAAIGDGTPYCGDGDPITDVGCSRLMATYDGFAKKVAEDLAGMPRTTPYRKVAVLAATFRAYYNRLVNLLGCYRAQPGSLATADNCAQGSEFCFSSWYQLRAAIKELGGLS